MRTLKTLKNNIAIVLLLSLMFSLCSCSDGVPFFRKDNRTIDDFKREATEVSVRLINRIFKGDYDTLKNFVTSDEAKQIKPVLNDLSPEMARDAILIVEEVFTEEGSYDTEVHYLVSFQNRNCSASFTFVMKMAREGNGWIISNALPLFSDMQVLNETYLDWRIKNDIE